MNEDALIRKLRRWAPLIGDDCAVIPWTARHDLLLKADLTIENVHFRRDLPPAHVGYRSVARSLSDIAAMGGKPKYCLIAIAAASWNTPHWIDEFFRGVRGILRLVKASLAGGDISHAGQFVCDAVVVGSVPHGKALRRSGARPGDAIYVSGALGGWRRRKIIKPRFDIGSKLIGKASASMDISDGLALDLHRLCLASRVSADLDRVPLLPSATLKQALHDGEDYELLYTAPERVHVPGIRIGTIAKGRAGAVRYRGELVAAVGYDHFQHRS